MKFNYFIYLGILLSVLVGCTKATPKISSISSLSSNLEVDKSEIKSGHLCLSKGQSRQVNVICPDLRIKKVYMAVSNEEDSAQWSLVTNENQEPLNCANGTLSLKIPALDSIESKRLFIKGESEFAKTESISVPFKDSSASVIAITNATPIVTSKKGTVQLNVSGGEIPYSFRILEGTGSVSTEGIFTAPDSDNNEVDVIEVTDAGCSEAKSVSVEVFGDFGLTLSGLPGDPSTTSALDVSVNLFGVNAIPIAGKYKYVLRQANPEACGDSELSSQSEVDSTIHIVESLSANQKYILCVIGKRQDGTWQSAADAKKHIWTRDTIQPTVVLASGGKSAFNSNPIEITVTFSEAVSGLELGDFAVVGGTAANLSGVGDIYKFDLSADQQGVVGVKLNATSVADMAGNSNLESAQLDLTFDTDAPTLTLNTTSSAVTNLQSIEFTAILSEPSLNFVSGDLILTNATLLDFSGSGTSYTFHIKPKNSGLFGVLVNDQAFTDAAGNPLSGVQSSFLTYDNTAPTSPTLVINSGATKTNLNLVNLSVSAVGGASEQKLSESSDCSLGTWEAYNPSPMFTLSSGDGVKNLSIQFRDPAGNISTCATSSITLDTTPPIGNSLDINSGATTTNTNILTLSLGSTGATKMYLTESSGCASGGTWENFAASKSWTVTSGAYGTKTIYAKFQDDVGNISACISDSINYQAGTGIYSLKIIAPRKIPHDNLVTATLYVVPKLDNVNIGNGKIIEMNLSQSGLIFTTGSDCRTVSTSCRTLQDMGNGLYGVSFKANTSGDTTLSFTMVKAGGDVNFPETHFLSADSTAFTVVSANTTLTSAIASSNIYITGGTVTFDASTQGVEVGDIYITGGTIKHAATTTTLVNRLHLKVNSLTMSAGIINADGLGFKNGYSWGDSGPSMAFSSAVASNIQYGAGGSHIGRGGSNSFEANLNSGISFDNPMNPDFPGGGPGHTDATYPGAGGGVVKIQSTGPCIINGTARITANGLVGGAGGTVNLLCEILDGTLSANAIQANGDSAGTTLPAVGAGGGGAIAIRTPNQKTYMRGSFAVPSTSAEALAFVGKLQAYGGSGAVYGGKNLGASGAGSIYLKAADMNYGSILFFNNSINWDSASADTRSYMPSFTGTITSKDSAKVATLVTTSTPSLSSNTDGLYNGLKLRPDINFTNGTGSDLTDDGIVTIESSTNNSFTFAEDLAANLAGKTFRTIYIFDQIYLGGNALLGGEADVYSINGNFGDTSSFTITNGFPELQGGNLTSSFGLPNITTSSLIQSIDNLTAQSLTFNSGTLYFNDLNLNSMTIGGGLLSGNSITANSFTTTNGTLSLANQLTVNGNLNNSVMTFTSPLVNVTGKWTITSGNITTQVANVGNGMDINGGTLKHPATTATTAYKLELNITGAFNLTSGSIDVSGLGYLRGYSFGASGPSTALAGATSTGGSHGGIGGSAGAGPTYDDYKDPRYPGGGGATSSFDVGGGVVRVIASQNCNIGSGTIKANGACSTAGGAGGSILLKCGGISGAPVASAIQANGIICGGGYGGGGGGRISIVSTGDSSTMNGSFKYPTTSSELTSLLAAVSAAGGGTTYGGGAGTIYITNTDKNYGGLIVSNNQTTLSNYNDTTEGETQLVSMAGTVGVASGNNLPIVVTSSPSMTSAFVNLYKGIKVRPDVNFNNGTANNWTDDNLYTVDSNDANQLTMTQNLVGTTSGTSFRSIDIFDNIEVLKGGFLRSNGDIFTLNGDFSGSGLVLNLNYGWYDMLGSALYNFTIGNAILSGTFSKQNFTGTSLTLNGTGSITFDSINVSGDLNMIGTPTLVTQDLSVGGNLTLNGGTLKHSATTATTVYRLQANVGGNFTLAGGSIDVSGLGYPRVYSFGLSGPSTLLGSGLNGGGSHGGRGGMPSVSGPTYDDYADPFYPGGGGYQSAQDVGGGVIRLNVTGNCNINSGTIKANGACSMSGGAGGSIMLKCNGFSGTPAASTVQANGAYCSAGYGAGGGGRVALISTAGVASMLGSFKYPTNSTELTTLTGIIKADGNGTSAYSGGAGTIYIKHADQSYGGMIIDNNVSSLVNYNASYTGSTQFVSLSGTNGTPAGNDLPVTVTSSPTLSAGYIGLYKNVKIRPDITLTNGTPNDYTDDSVLSISNNDATKLTMTSSVSGSLAGKSFRSVDIFDNFEILNGSYVKTNGDIQVLNGNFSNPGVNSAISYSNSIIEFLTGGKILPGLGNVVINGPINLPTANFNVTNFTYNGTNILTINNLDATGTVTITNGTITIANNINAGTLTTSGSANISVAGNVTTNGNLSIQNTGGFTAGTITSNGNFTQTAGATTTQSVLSAGNFTMSGGTMTSPASTLTVEKKLDLQIGGYFLLQNAASIDVSGKGYIQNTSWSIGGVSSAAAVLSSNNAGSSHGGSGAFKASGTLSNVGPSYGNYQAPITLGAGNVSSCGLAAAGGGAVRLNVVGSCQMDGTSSIRANAGGSGAAGGSVFLSCNGISGSTTGGISVTGGNSISSGYLCGGGGGGRIALVSTAPETSFTGVFAYYLGATNLANFKNLVKATGGALTSTTYAEGGAGTIYIKHSNSIYGDLIVDNSAVVGSVGISANSGRTELLGANDNSNILNSTISSSEAKVTSASVPFVGRQGIFAGLKIHIWHISVPSPFYNASGHTQLTLAGNGDNSLIASGGTFPAIANDYRYRMLYQFDHLDIGLKTYLDASKVDISLQDCDLHSSAGVFEVPFSTLQAQGKLFVNSFSAPACGTISSITTDQTIWPVNIGP